MDVKELEMDMRDWYMMAFKSSRHGWVGATSQKLIAQIGKELHAQRTPSPAIREASGGVEMAMSATPEENFELTPEP